MLAERRCFRAQSDAIDALVEAPGLPGRAPATFTSGKSKRSSLVWSIVEKLEIS